MVMLVWWILSLFGVCEFTWLPVLIDFGLGGLYMCFAGTTGESGFQSFFGEVALGFASFACGKCFYSLTISGWWMLLAPVWLMIAILVPGGFTITNILFNKFNLITLPTWGLVVGIVVDVIGLLIEIFALISYLKER